jgi:uncharacterized membrane protein YdjX (TVP38/TMEM64 family)
LVVIFVLAVAVYFSSNLKGFFTDPARIKEYVVSYGSFGPIVLILFHIIQTVIFFIPGPFISIGGGYVFGVWLGTFYNIIGSTVGTMLTFFIARHVGQGYFLKWMDQREYRHIEKVLGEKGAKVVFFARLFPIFPNDVVTIAAGVSPINAKDFSIASFIGYIPTLYLENLFGEELNGAFTLKTAILAGVLLLLGLTYLLRNKIKLTFIKEVHEIEKELSSVESKIGHRLHVK